MKMVALCRITSWIVLMKSVFLATFKSAVEAAAIAVEAEAATAVAALLLRLRFLPADDDDDVVLVVFLAERRALVVVAAAPLLPPFFVPPLDLDWAGFFDPVDPAFFCFLVLAAPVVLAAAFLAGRALACSAPFFFLDFAMVAAVLSFGGYYRLD